MVNSADINYNTFIQTAPLSQADGSQGLSIATANISQGPILSETVDNNTMVTANNGGYTEGYLIIADTGNLDGSATVQNNYIDPTGTAYNWIFVGQYNQGSSNEGSYNGTVTESGNIDMTTGRLLSGRLRR